MADLGRLLRLPAPASREQVGKILRADDWGPGKWTLVLRSVAKAERLDLSLQLLELIQAGRLQADVFHYSAAISPTRGLWPSALSMLRRAEDTGITPNEYTFGNVMQSIEYWLLALHCLHRMLQSHLRSNSVTQTTLINSYAQQHQWEQALSQHSSPQGQTSFTVAAAMSACDKSCEWDRCLRLFDCLSSTTSTVCPSDSRPPRDVVCYGLALASTQSWQIAEDLLAEMATESLRSNSLCYNAAISSCESEWEAALRLFSHMCAKRLEVGLCRATVAHVCRGSWESALCLLQGQLDQGIPPDAALAGSVVQAIAEGLGTGIAEDLLLKLLDLWKLQLPSEKWIDLPDAANVLVCQPGLLVLCKPPGITSEAAVTNLVGLAGTGLRMVSRLDAQTSGILPLAVGEVAARYFQAQFAARLVQKEYTCLCEGAPLGQVGTTGKISEPLLTTGVDGVNSRTRTSAEGRESHTAYLVKSRYSIGTPRSDTELILLRVRPLTGRTHQIRVHLASIGRPIVGDVIYGTKHSKVSAHLFLHCGRIRLRDFIGRRLTVRAPLPRDLTESLINLEENQNRGHWAGMRRW